MSLASSSGHGFFTSKSNRPHFTPQHVDASLRVNNLLRFLIYHQFSSVHQPLLCTHEVQTGQIPYSFIRLQPLCKVL